jgi:hypothetical protein
MQVKRQNRTTQKDEEKRARPVECRAVDVVGGGPKCPKELQKT